MRYDAIVVGAGPAGSTAARLLAQKGASVLLLDRARFPRDKPCGGGVTIRAAACLDLDISPVVERTIHGCRFSLRLGPSFDRRYHAPLAYMTQRRRLDAFLAEAAGEAGADFHHGEAVRAIALDNCRVSVRTDSGSYAARTIIGADGANGIVGRATGTCPRLEPALALAGNLPLTADFPERWREMVALDLGALPGGYGWVFPKGDHLNIGVGAWQYAAARLRPRLAALCRRYGFRLEALQNLRGHRLPVRRPSSAIARGPVALIGDAAGLIDPLAGEGIHMAFRSGRYAARAVLGYLAGQSPDLSPYQQAVDSRLQPELTAARKLQELFHFAPPPYVALLRHSQRFWHLFCHIIRGEITYRGFLRLLGPLAPLVDFFAEVARQRRLSNLTAEK